MSNPVMREHNLARDVKAVLNDLEDLLTAVSDGSREGLSAVQPRMEAGIRDARSRLAEMDAVLAARTRRLADRTDAYVRGHPWETAATAAAAGAAIGALLGAMIAHLYDRR